MHIDFKNRNVEWEYLQWLGEVVGETNSSDPSQTYSLLLEQLFRKEFYWSIEHDDNRTHDALRLRELFLYQFGGRDIVGGASVLEIMVVLSDKLAYDMSEVSDDVAFWFRDILSNLNLDRYTDEYYLSDYTTNSQVDNIINRVLNRRYKENGEGGFFPLNNPPSDQRGVELWDQVSSYILEQSGYR